jgi:integral membrane protein (TIGR01906 family)
MRKIFKFIIDLFLSMAAALLTVGICVITVLNIKSIYVYAIEKYNLLSKVNITQKALLEDYRGLIKYLQNPFMENLKFNSFIMSEGGEFHFYEVKKIFLGIYLIVILSVFIFLIYLLVKKYKKEKNEIIKILNNGANILIALFTVLLIAITTNFSRAFVIFHKIFFNNDYWIFDAKTDPIITVLPEEVFKLYAIIIVALTVILIIIYKVLYYKSRKRSIIK